jgi:hypothetical protein
MVNSRSHLLSKYLKFKYFIVNWIRTSLFIFFFYALVQITDWIPLRYWKAGDGKFGDLFQVLKWSDCYKVIGVNIYENNPGEICSNYIYGFQLVRILSKTSITASDTYFLGSVFILLFSVVFGLIASKVKHAFKYVLILPIVLSPPLLLLIERGNLDILVFILLFISTSLFYIGFEKFALIPLMLAVITKFYAAPIFLVYLVFNRNYRNRLFTFILFLVSMVNVLFDLERIKTDFPKGGSWYFGMSVWARYLEIPAPNHVLSEEMNNLVGVFIFITLFGTILYLVKKSSLVTLNNFSMLPSNIYYFYFSVFLIVHLSCFITGVSFDYRLIYIIFAASCFMISYEKHLFKVVSRLVYMLLLISIWHSFPSDGLQPIGDLALEILTIILGISFVINFRKLSRLMANRTHK